MAAEPHERQTHALTVRSDQMLFAIPVEEEGIEETLFTTEDIEPAGDEPIKLAGAWSHLNWDEALAFFDRLDRESVPSDPILGHYSEC